MPTFSLLNIQGYEHSRSPTLDHMLKHSLIEYHIPFFLPLHIMMIDNWELPQTCKTINLKLDKKCLSSQYAIYNHYNSKTRKGSLFFILFYTVVYSQISTSESVKRIALSSNIYFDTELKHSISRR